MGETPDAPDASAQLRFEPVT
jgi:hypothetical protein